MELLKIPKLLSRAYGWVFLSLLVLAISACNDKVETTREVHIECMQEHLTDMQNILDTATIGDVDGTFPQINANELATAIDDLKMGLSKARAGAFALQYEADNYCIASDKAIADFYDSYQFTLPAGTPAELLVFGTDKKGHIDFGESSAYGASSSFTVETWLKYDKNFFEYAIADLVATFSHDGNNVKQGWMVNFSGDNLRTTLGMGPQQDRVLEWGKAYPKVYNKWMHVVATYDGSAAEDQLKMYIDGELFFSKTNDIKDESGTLQQYQANTRNLKMWAFMEPEDNSRCMTGYMKKFRLWSKAKTLDEIKSLMNADVAGNEANLICAWDFTVVPDNNENIADKTGRHTAKLVGKYKWKPIK